MCMVLKAAEILSTQDTHLITKKNINSLATCETSIRVKGAKVQMMLGEVNGFLDAIRNYKTSQV